MFYPSEKVGSIREISIIATPAQLEALKDLVVIQPNSVQPFLLVNSGLPLIRKRLNYLFTLTTKDAVETVLELSDVLSRMIQYAQRRECIYENEQFDQLADFRNGENEEKTVDFCRRNHATDLILSRNDIIIDLLTRIKNRISVL